MKPKPTPLRREGKQTPAGAPPESAVTEAHRSRRSKPCSDDLYARIARRAYELYERGGRHDGLSIRDWLQAERDIRGS
jgi:uncharacterized protein with von Willebrand factor type A (vWA) domain